MVWKHGGYWLRSQNRLGSTALLCAGSFLKHSFLHLTDGVCRIKNPMHESQLYTMGGHMMMRMMMTHTKMLSVLGVQPGLLTL